MDGKSHVKRKCCGVCGLLVHVACGKIEDVLFSSRVSGMSGYFCFFYIARGEGNLGVAGPEESGICGFLVVLIC